MSVIIRLQNLPMSANASNIRRFFSGLAIPEGGVHIVGGNDGDAFIAFATDEDARKAMLLDRQAINGAAVRLLLSSKTEMQTIIETARSSALFPPPVHNPSSQTMLVQKPETIQALDTTNHTLPTSFPSYRNGEARGMYSSEIADQLNYAHNIRNSTMDHSHNPSPFENPSECRQPMRPMGQPHLNDLQRRDNNYDTAPPTQQLQRYDEPRVTRDSPSQYTSYYNDGAVFDRRRDEQAQMRQDEKPRGDPRVPFADPRFERIPQAPMNYERTRSPAPFSDRFISTETVRERRDLVIEPNMPPFRGENYSNQSGYPYDCGNMHPPVRPPNERDFLQQPVERDFSVRPPWLNDNNPPGLKRVGPPPVEHDEYPRKRPFPTVNRSANESSETDFVVRVTLPVSEVGIKPIFEILRGVHIVPKWGIRIEEDSLQRPTGYIFIMMTARDSYDRALAYNGKPYKGFPVKVLPSSAAEFYKVTDSNFRNKCPTEIVKKLPPADQPSSPPHHSDGCLEITEFPRDATKSEIVRFLGAPGLNVDSVVIARYAANDKTATHGSDSIRALVTLPSAKDIGILLSAKPRPLRPDGTCPPVRLSAISRMQLEAYSVFRMEDKLPVPVVAESNTISRGVAETPSKISVDPLCCAYLSGLSKSMRDSDVIRLFSTVLIPGDAIKMVSPENTSAYIDFISENNCRRAITDITANDSKAKAEHPRLSIEALSRSDMEQRCSLTKDDTTHPIERTTRNQLRDPRDNRNQWDTWSRGGHHLQPPQFLRRSPPTRPKFDDYQDRNIPPKHFEEIPYETFAGHQQRPLPPVDFPFPGLPPMHNDVIPPRSSEPPPMGGPPRRVPMVNAATVFISNLPPSVTPEQLANVMRDYYFIPGSIRLRRDLQGIPTGDALVDFRSTYDADRTVRELTGYRIAGRSIIMRHNRPADL